MNSSTFLTLFATMRKSPACPLQEESQCFEIPVKGGDTRRALHRLHAAPAEAGGAARRDPEAVRTAAVDCRYAGYV